MFNGTILSTGTAVAQAALLITKNDAESSVSLSTCKIILTNEDWDSVYYVRAKGIVDQIYDGDHILQQRTSIEFSNAIPITVSEQLDIVEVLTFTYQCLFISIR